MRFHEWISKQRDRNDEVGAFALSVASHRDFPIEATEAEMVKFVDAMYGELAVQTLRNALSEYKKASYGSIQPPQGIVFGAADRQAKLPNRARIPTPAKNVPTTGNLFAGHATLDRAKLPMKPPGRN